MVTVAAVAALTGGAVSAPSAPSPPAALAASLFDRTLLCDTLPVGGGLYELEVRAQDGIRQTRTTWKSLAFAAVASGRSGRVDAPLETALAWSGAGPYVHRTNLEEWDVPIPPDHEGTLAFSQRKCRRTTTRVPLSARGLTGGRAGPFSQRYDCFVPRRVLIRVRATFTRPPTFFGAGGFLRTKAVVERAALAVRTPAGRRIAYATVSSSGKAVLMTARDCVPE